MNLKVITLELARNPGQPAGDHARGYIFRAPLDTNNHFDHLQWPAVKEFCTVQRIENGRPVESGLLVHTRRGEWVFSYVRGDEDDETLFRFAKHRFVPGEYVSITEHDGVQRTFKVAAITEWHPDRTPASAVT